jgi:hypothetical protein
MTTIMQRHRSAQEKQRSREISQALDKMAKGFVA